MTRTMKYTPLLSKFSMRTNHPEGNQWKQAGPKPEPETPNLEKQLRTDT